MRTTVTLDDDLIAEAQKITGMSERSLLIKEGLKALIEREAAKRLAALGGTEPGIKVTRRRQSEKL